MHRIVIGLMGAATMLLASPASAQDFPLKGGNYWEVAEISVDDGHFGDYADHLAGLYRRTSDFAKSKGWIKSYHILSNFNKRSNEPDLYLVTISDRIATPAESEARQKELNAYLQSSERQQDSLSGARAKFRHLGGTMMLQEMNFRK
jgi:hypothetical protein